MALCRLSVGFVIDNMRWVSVLVMAVLAVAVFAGWLCCGAGGWGDCACGGCA